MSNIINFTILKYNQQVPRYTSYPTAPHFNSQINGDVYKEWLQNLSSKENLSLYLHIPFCQQMCWYCGCYTKVTKRYAPVEDYAYILAREINLVAELIPTKKPVVSHIHFGGGSPTILLPDTFEHLIKTIKSKFEIASDAEIAIEVDPRNVNEEKIAAYAKAGINRVSIGVQDFNIEVQRAINREQSFDLVYNCIKLFRKYGINDINLDLIYGLPKQTVEGVERNIEYSMLLKPKRIALFGYAHVGWMKKHMRLINEADLPNGEERILMYQAAVKKLNQFGYMQIGLDHFAVDSDKMSMALKSKKLKRNFQGYSTDSAESLIGFGVSAIGQLPAGYIQNTLDFAEYKKNILAEKLPIIKGIKTNLDDKIRKEIIDEIMCYMEVDLNKICTKFKLSENYFTKEIEALSELKKDRLITIKHNVIKVNPQAPQITRIVSSAFDKFFIPSTAKHSKVA